MNMAIGFGSTELAFENQEEKAFHDYVEQAFSQQSVDYFTKEIHTQVSEWMKQRAHDYQVLSSAHDKATDHPDRYSYYHAHVLDDANYMVAVVKFMHINRRHALSPDGWGMMISQRVFTAALSDIRGAAPPRSHKATAEPEAK